MTSCGGPLRRRASPGLLPPEVCGVRVRVRVSGLYWKTTALPAPMPAATRAPFWFRGEPGNVDIDTSSRPERLEEQDQFLPQGHRRPGQGAGVSGDLGVEVGAEPVV